MKNKTTIILKKVLFGIIILMLLSPILQEKFQFVKMEPLNGAIVEREDSEFEWQYWFAGIYQNEKTKYMNENIGFRNFFIRTNNQFYYSLFKIAKANGVVVGKENYLYEYQYIKSYLGHDFIGIPEIKRKMERLNIIKDSLNNRGIDLLIVFAPSKGRYYSEYIPDKYFKNLKFVSNYEIYREELLKSDIPFIDFNQWFRDQKEKSEYPLMPKNGIHWSRYGELLALDSIVNYINSMPRDKKAGTFITNDIKVSNQLEFTDEDIELGMNLLFELPDFNMAYPEIIFEEDTSRIPAKVLTIGDSFFWGVYGTGISSRVFDNGEFWYYNREIFSVGKPTRLVQNIDVKKEVEKNDVVMLLFTETNLVDFGSGFVEKLFNSYLNLADPNNEREQRVQEIITAIKNTPDWLNSIEAKAQINNISLEKAIRIDAEYMVDQQDLENKKKQ